MTASEAAADRSLHVPIDEAPLGISDDESPEAHDQEDDLERMEREIEDQNEGLNTKDLVKIAIFVAIGAILIYIVLGVFGFLSQAEYGGP